MTMSTKETGNNTEMDLQALEIRVEELIRACSFLKDENKSLRQKQEHLVAERATLIEKTELARARVEAMITRLKSMESPQ
jgi:cell division protein ZapB